MTQFNQGTYPIHRFDENVYGRIQMRGADALSLLQRLTTNDMLKLQPGQGCQTVLTTPIGRIIDVLHVINAGDVIWVITSSNQGPTVYNHLKKNIFFNDKVTIAPGGRAFAQCALYGDDVTQWLEQTYAVSLSQLPLWHVVHHDDMMMCRIAPVGGAGWRLLWPTERAHGDALTSLPLLAADQLSTWQIEAGVPEFGTELTLDYIPLEAGLWSAISFAKGCYVGQEIIARMESRGRLAKTLTRVRLNAPHQTPTPIVTTAGKEAGVLTRMTDSPRFGHIGLAYLSTKIEPDVTLHIDGDVITRCDEHWSVVTQ
jgi:aminomethyltransferase